MWSVMEAENLRLVPGKPLDSDEHERILEVTKMFAEAFASLNPEAIISSLTKDAVYEGQHILNPIIGREKISAYLRARYKNIRDRKSETPVLEIGEVDLPEGSAYPCAIGILEDKPQMLFVLKIDARSMIERIDSLSVMPTPDLARRSGVVYGR